MQKSRALTVLSLVFFMLSGACSFAQQAVYPAELTVSQDGSGNYKTIQEAVNAVRDLGRKRVIIHIRKGVYHEKIVIPSWKTNISLVGEDKEQTIINHDDYSGKSVPAGKDAFGKDKMTTYTSYTVLIQGNDVQLENLTIENTAGRVGQAVALHVEGDRVLVKNCRLLGNQDTLYAATANSRQYYVDCFIAGTTDFIFGEATVLFKRCTIKSLTNSYITAAATTPFQEFGFVFLDCKLVSDTTATKVYLGRPWRPYAKQYLLERKWASTLPLQGGIRGKATPCFPTRKKPFIMRNTAIPGQEVMAPAGYPGRNDCVQKEVKKYTIKRIFAGKGYWDPETVSQYEHDKPVTKRRSLSLPRGCDGAGRITTKHYE